jgi:hypothetical protein
MLGAVLLGPLIAAVPERGGDAETCHGENYQ